MSYNVGKVTNYDGNCGEIVTNLGKYIFLSKDLQSSNIKQGSIVIFRSEIINNEHRAFFIKEFDKVLNEENTEIKNARLLKQFNNQ